MRSKSSTELLLAWLATATMEGAWLTLANNLLQWMKRETQLSLGILTFSVAVAAGMLLSRTFRNVPQARYALILTAAAVVAAIAGALMSGAPSGDPGAFVRTALIDPGVWLMGFAVLRGAMHGEPGSGYSAERVFAVGIPALVVFWVFATINGLAANATFASASFAATLSFISAGLLALGLGRLSDLDVDSIDRSARRRWILLVVGIVAVVLVVGVPLAAILGVPVASAAFGVLGPVAPLLIGLFYLMSIPVFWLLELLGGFLNPLRRPIGTLPAPPTPIGNGPPPLFEPPTGPPPDLTWLVIAIVVVGIFVLLRIVFLFLQQPATSDRAPDESESRVAEPFVMPRLPRVKLPRLGRRPAPQTASEAYQRALAALSAGPLGRLRYETPREHAARVAGTDVGRDIGRLAADYQLQTLAAAPLTTSESRRALARWRRVARNASRAH